jgi:hypothetical protein
MGGMPHNVTHIRWKMREQDGVVSRGYTRHMERWVWRTFMKLGVSYDVISDVACEERQ